MLCLGRAVLLRSSALQRPNQVRVKVSDDELRHLSSQVDSNDTTNDINDIG
jgi:hypothetical protein